MTIGQVSPELSSGNRRRPARFFYIDLVPKGELPSDHENWDLSSAREPLDMGPALAELVLDALEAAVEVIDPADDGLPLGR